MKYEGFYDCTTESFSGGAGLRLVDLNLMARDVFSIYQKMKEAVFRTAEEKGRGAE